ncbi:MAG: D-alanyl-D-alanine carboxypeptidase [Chitinophagaceae bacterium]
MKRNWLILAVATVVLYGCSPAKKIGGTVTPTSMEILLADSALAGAHTGIYVYNPASGKALYSYQSDKYFVPASNTKLFTCYAGMKYLGDSLVGLRYTLVNDSQMVVQPAGDPTFFHSDFKTNPVYDFLKKQPRHFTIDASNWKETGLGNGWAWNDYDELYMSERSPMPIYENALTLTLKKTATLNDNIRDKQTNSGGIGFSVTSFPTPELAYHFKTDSALKTVYLKRDFSKNNFFISAPAKAATFETQMPFVTDGIKSTKEILMSNHPELLLQENQTSDIGHRTWLSIHSQPTDSLFKPMMHRSDNFFAEQTLLMVSNEKLGYMNDRAIIDMLLKTDLADLPQQPVWVDGSGLSRYNLFTPQDFVKVLEKMKNEFGLERMKVILPTGGEGTISSYYKSITNQIFAKTGTLSGQVAISGYLFTKSNTLLLFSILVNNQTNTATAVRKALEKFVLDIWEKN